MLCSAIKLPNQYSPEPHAISALDLASNAQTLLANVTRMHLCRAFCHLVKLIPLTSGVEGTALSLAARLYAPPCTNERF